MLKAKYLNISEEIVGNVEIDDKYKEKQSLENSFQNLIKTYPKAKKVYNDNYGYKDIPKLYLNIKDELE